MIVKIKEVILQNFQQLDLEYESNQNKLDNKKIKKR